MVMLLKSALLALFFLLMSFRSYAELSIQIEPIAFFQNGYDVEVALKIASWRYGVGLTKSRYPILIKEEATFNIESKVLSAHLDYFLQSKTGGAQGLFFGPSFHRVRWMFFHPESGLKLRRDSDYLGPQLGYVMRFGEKKSLLLQGALAYEKNIRSKHDVTVRGETNEIPDDVIIPSIVFGIGF